MTHTEDIPDVPRVSDCGCYLVAENHRGDPVWVVRHLGVPHEVRPWTNGRTIEDANTGLELRIYGSADIITSRQPDGSTVAVRRQPVLT